MSTIDDVLEFHKAFGIPVPDAPRMPPNAYEHIIQSAVEYMQTTQRLLRIGAEKGCRRCLRLSLEVEELRELAEALRDNDLEAALDAQVDREYILQGTNIALGFHAPSPNDPFERICDVAFERVHEANMAKLVDGKPVVDAAGKIRKPEGWKAPELGDLVK